MTNEEAVKILEECKEKGFRYTLYTLDEYHEALEKAIEALKEKQEPKFIVKTDGTIEQIKNCDDCLFKKEWEKIGKLISVILGKQTEQEPSGDAISREETLTAFADYVGSGMSMDDFDALFNIVVRMPPVTPQPKMGRWNIGRIFPTKVSDENLIEYRCSECDRAIRCTESQLVNYPYCHCGARMVEPQEKGRR